MIWHAQWFIVNTESKTLSKIVYRKNIIQHTHSTQHTTYKCCSSDLAKTVPFYSHNTNPLNRLFNWLLIANHIKKITNLDQILSMIMYYMLLKADPMTNDETTVKNEKISCAICQQVRKSNSIDIRVEAKPRALIRYNEGGGLNRIVTWLGADIRIGELN